MHQTASERLAAISKEKMKTVEAGTLGAGERIPLYSLPIFRSRHKATSHLLDQIGYIEGVSWHQLASVLARLVPGCTVLIVAVNDHLPVERLQTRS